MNAAGVLARGPWQPDDVRCAWEQREYDPGAEATAAADAAIAELRRRDSPSYDGLAARLEGFAIDDGGLDMTLAPMRWSLRLGDDARDSLSALCVVRDSEGRWLAGRRADWVASWAGRWALGAGGSVEVGEDPVVTLTRELEEEWSVRPRRLTVEALVRNTSGLVLLIGQAVLEPGAEVERDREHDAHAWWPADPELWPAADAHAALRMIGDLLG